MSVSSGGEESGIGAFPSLDTEDKDVSPAFAERDYRGMRTFSNCFLHSENQKISMEKAFFFNKFVLDHRQVYVGLHHMPAEKPVKKTSKLPKFTLAGPPKSFRWENGKRTTKQVIDSASEAEGEGWFSIVFTKLTFLPGFLRFKVHYCRANQGGVLFSKPMKFSMVHLRLFIKNGNH